MADITTGFAGSVDQVEDSIRSAYQGSAVPVVQTRAALEVTPNAAGTRTVNVAGGTSWAHGVRRSLDPFQVGNFDAVTASGQARWDALVIRRDWTTRTATPVVVKGTAAAVAPEVLPAGLNDRPGDVHDQVLALVQITFGSTVPVVRDRRLVAHKTVTAPSLAALPVPTPQLYGMEAVVAGARYRCAYNTSNNLAWMPASPYRWTNQSEVVGSGSGFTGSGLANRAGYNPGTGDVQLDVQMRRSGTTVSPSATGNFSPDIVLATLLDTDLFPDRDMPVSGDYRAASGAFYPWHGVLRSADGALVMYSGTAGAELAPFTGATNATLVSVRCHVRYTRKV